MRRGDEVYEMQVRPNIKAEDEGKFAAVDIDSGEYEVDEDELTAGDKLRARLPVSQIWMVRIGSRYVHRFRSGGPKGNNLVHQGQDK